jgi:hypothetical protein
MTKSIGMTQARSKLAELVGRVAYGGEHLVGRAHRLPKRLGDPVDGLTGLLSSLPPEGDTFWLELIEEMP